MEEFKDLYEALGAVQTHIVPPRKDASNPIFGKEYVSLDAIIVAINKAIVEVGAKFFWTNTIKDDVMYTVISGYNAQVELAGSKIVIDGRNKRANDVQIQGAAITYARRYSISMAFGVATDTDDDAVSIQSQHGQNQQQRNRPQQQNTQQTRQNQTQNQVQNVQQQQNRTQNVQNQTKNQTQAYPKSRKMIFNNIIAEIAKKQNVPLEQINSEITNYCKSLPEMAGVDKDKAWDILIKHAERVLAEPVLVEG